MGNLKWRRCLTRGLTGAWQPSDRMVQVLETSRPATAPVAATSTLELPMRCRLTTFLLLGGLTAPLAAQIRARELALPDRSRLLLPTPLVLTAAATSPSSISVQWPGVPGAAEYRVFHGPSPSGPWIPVARVPASVAQIEDRGLVPSTTFQYQVVAFSDTGGQSPLGTILGAGTTGSVPALSATASCNGPTSVLNGEQVRTCTWSWAAVPLAVSYRVHRVLDRTFIATAANCVGETTEDVMVTQYSRNDVQFSGATCGHHFEFGALYRRPDYPVAGQTLVVEGPRYLWRPY